MSHGSLRSQRDEVLSLQRYSEELEGKLLEKNHAIRNLTAELAVETCRNRDLNLRIAQLEKALVQKTNKGKKEAADSCLQCRVQ